MDMVWRKTARSLLAALVLAFQPLFATTPGSSHWGLEQSTARLRFEQELLQFFDSAQTGGRIGLTVWSQKERKWLHTIRPDTAFTPASTLKLLTTATALDTFDPNWRPQTLARLYGKQEGKRFRGRLSIVGRGDPSLSGRFFSDPLEPLRLWADTLKSIGIDTIVGSIEVDRLWFPDPAFPETWAPRFRDRWFGAEITALSFNDNCALLRILPGAAAGDSVIVSVQPQLNHFQVEQRSAQTITGKRRNIRYALDRHSNTVTVSGSIGVDARPLEVAIPVRHSQYWFESALREALRQSGIELVPESHPLLLPLFGELQFTSAPLASIMTEVNTRSQNFYAESLLRLIGAEKGGIASVAEGHKAVRSLLLRSEIDPEAFTLLDGSGLSLGNRVEPRAINLLLQRMLAHPQLNLWWNSLAWPGVGSRMRGFAYPYRTRYKTGFVSQVQGLAGYITTALGDTLTVALYMNGYSAADHKAREMMDALWMRIADHEDAERRQLHLARLAHATVSDVSARQKRILQLSSQWIGTPYVASPTGEGARGEISDAPLIRIDGMDCVTFVENSLAIAHAPSPDSILSTLTRIRYRDGVADFRHRNHFLVDDWIAENSRKGVIALQRLPGDTLWNRTMGRRFFAQANGLDSSGVKDLPSTLWLLPREKAISYLENLRSKEEEVMGIALIGKPEWLWATHVGLLLLKPDRSPTLRHASTLRKIVTDQSVIDYLQEQKSIQGILLFKIL